MKLKLHECEGRKMMTFPEFARKHEITWSAVYYLRERDIIDVTDRDGVQMVVLTPKTKKYVPNRKG